MKPLALATRVARRLAPQRTQPRPFRVLSLSWGRQTACLAYMAALGEIPRPDVVLNADPLGLEIDATYDYARRWTPWLEAHGLEIWTVGNGKARRRFLNKDAPDGSIFMPVYGRDRSQLPRQCTSTWKVDPVEDAVDLIMLERGIPRRPGAVETIIGMDYSEWDRIRTNHRSWVTNVYPLVDMKMTLDDCIVWLERHGFEVPPKSACCQCPYTSDGRWIRRYRQHGRDWQRAVDIDRRLRTFLGTPYYLHDSRRPLEVVIPELAAVQDAQPGLFPDEEPALCGDGSFACHR